MEKQKTTNKNIITYEDYLLDDWLFEMIDDLLANDPNFYEEITEIKELKGE